MMMRYKRWLVFVAILSLMVGGCRKPASDDQAGRAAYDPTKDPLVNPPVMFEPAPEDLAQIATDETLYLVLEGNPNTLNPLFISSMVEFLMVDTLYSGPFTFDKDMTWKLYEDWVESFEESEDHTVCILKLKPGLTWHDGVPLTAHDIVYSWGQILDDRVPCQTQKATTEPIKECVALDDLTVKYVQPDGLATRLWNLIFPIIPKHIFEVDKTNNPDLLSGTYYNQQARHPVGSGPYKIVEWIENDKIVVERWEDYKGKKPYFKRVVFKIIPDQNMCLLAFEKGDIDVIWHMSAQQFAYESNTDSFKRVGHKSLGREWGFSYICWNMDGSNPFFTDKRVRYAMTHALNLPLIREKILYNLPTICLGEYHPDSWMFNPDVQPLGYDLERSKALLDEAGWVVDPQDGWRYKTIDGEKVKFTFTLTYSQGSASTPKIAAVFQEDLKKIRVEMQTHIFEWATFVQKIRKHEFQAEMAAWGTGTDPDTSWNLWRTEEYITGRNYGGYSNPIVDELFVQGRKEFDFEKRKKIYQEIHKILYEDQPYTWMFNAASLSAINNRIRGVQFSPRGIFNFDPSFYGWWVLKGQAKHAAVMP